MKKMLLALGCALVLAFGIASCDEADDCKAECSTHEDCGEGYLCYSDGLCDNEDRDCEEDE